MKPTVKIENGYVEIELTPENEFERTMLKDMKSTSDEFVCKITTKYKAYSYGEDDYSISLLRTKKQTTEKC